MGDSRPILFLTRARVRRTCPTAERQPDIRAWRAPQCAGCARLVPSIRTDVITIPRLRAGTAIVLDVRPEDEFRQGHLPGALNIPLAQLERRLADLPPDREIVAYCRGAWCVLSFEAGRLLRNRGYLRRREDGFRNGKWRVSRLVNYRKWNPDDPPGDEGCRNERINREI